MSGGQTGVDRAALDAAIALGVPHGGWCPLGRRSEDGGIPSRYVLEETDSRSYDVRTERNVIDSDGTVVFTRAPTVSGGTAFTTAAAARHGRPVVHVLESLDPEDAARSIAAFVREHRIEILNVAGPRESEEPLLGRYVRRVMEIFLDGFS